MHQTYYYLGHISFQQLFVGGKFVLLIICHVSFSSAALFMSDNLFSIYVYIRSLLVKIARSIYQFGCLHVRCGKRR